jgi:hypothetical protein
MIVPAAESSDEVLAARAAAGDDTAFEALVVRYQHRVFRLACRLTSETDAPDVVQSRSFRSIATYRRSVATRSSARGSKRTATPSSGCPICIGKRSRCVRRHTSALTRYMERWPMHIQARVTFWTAVSTLAVVAWEY